MSSMHAQARTAVVAMRLTLGVSTVVAPRRAVRVFGIDPEANPALPLPMKLYGAFNLAVAAALLAGGEREQQRWLRYGAAIDTFDAVAMLGGGARGYLPKQAVALGGTTALALAALGLIAQSNR